eukprot:scaffold14401_cov58-Cyclotella_meneghiniana.AAC.15
MSSLMSCVLVAKAQSASTGTRQDLLVRQFSRNNPCPPGLWVDVGRRGPVRLSFVTSVTGPRTP